MIAVVSPADPWKLRMISRAGKLVHQSQSRWSFQCMKESRCQTLALYRWHVTAQPISRAVKHPAWGNWMDCTTAWACTGRYGLSLSGRLHVKSIKCKWKYVRRGSEMNLPWFLKAVLARVTWRSCISSGWTAQISAHTRWGKVFVHLSHLRGKDCSAWKSKLIPSAQSESFQRSTKDNRNCGKRAMLSSTMWQSKDYPGFQKIIHSSKREKGNQLLRKNNICFSRKYN